MHILFDRLAASFHAAGAAGADPSLWMSRSILVAIEDLTVPTGMVIDAGALIGAALPADAVTGALARVSSFGVVSRIDESRYRVVPVEPDYLRAALVAWRSLYGVLLTEVVPRADEGTIADLREAAAKFAAAVDAVDRRAAARWNYAFFDRLVELSENDYLRAAIFEPVHVARIGAPELPTDVDTLALFAAHHRLISAVSDGDVASAVRALDDAVAAGLSR